MHAITDGGFLELVSEFEVAGGGEVDRTPPDTRVLLRRRPGRGLMRIADEEHEIVQGDLVPHPPNAVHSCARSAITPPSIASASRSA